MSALDLHRAATHMRADAFNGQTEDAPFLEVVAEWLDLIGGMADGRVDSFGFGCFCASCAPLQPALKVALAYLGRDA